MLESWKKPDKLYELNLIPLDPPEADWLSLRDERARQSLFSVGNFEIASSFRSSQ
ncbi:MAG: hypothetical protein V1833_06150 [Elusimicrobiota bacterium]